MLFPDRDALLKTYEADIALAYDQLLEAFVSHVETGEGDPRSMAGRCGAQVGAAHKRCKRGLVFAGLDAMRSEGMDITPTVAENLCTALIGRGVDVRVALDAFATPGRTAANKSKVGGADLEQLVAWLGPKVRSLILEMTIIRERYRDEYAERAKAAVEAVAKAAVEALKR
ncbi:hypothetical protein ACN99C_26660 (plasmid) [Pseudomonas alloputida]|uniref:hypothetical protein n=1 Tax=Pseudomonas alloputida TaxID=1940621 RepID=UPI003B42FC72